MTVPDEKRPHWVSLFKVPSANELLIRAKTKSGAEGFGLATSYTDISPLVNVVKSGLLDEITGMDALAPELVYEKLFGFTSSRLASENGWGKEALIRISSAVDIACWDVLGHVANLRYIRYLADTEIKSRVTSLVRIIETGKIMPNCARKSRC